jgi:hypothetical protein
MAKETAKPEASPQATSGQEQRVESDESQLASLLSQIREQLGLQDPDKIKRDVAMDVGQLTANIENPQQLSSQLSMIFSRHEPRGLKKLYVAESGAEFDVVAEASNGTPARRVLGMYKKGVGFCGLIVHINDESVFESGADPVIWNEGRGGAHAEERLAELFPGLLNNYTAREGKKQPHKVTVWIKYSPCLDRCYTALTALKKEHPQIQEWIINYVEEWVTGAHPAEKALESLKSLAAGGFIINRIMDSEELKAIKFESKGKSR